VISVAALSWPTADFASAMSKSDHYWYWRERKTRVTIVAVTPEVVQRVGAADCDCVVRRCGVLPVSDYGDCDPSPPHYYQY
jgi:hypothetical protein